MEAVANVTLLFIFPKKYLPFFGADRFFWPFIFFSDL
jgi:hypothetical protein